jgi:hypothetical protein
MRGDIVNLDWLFMADDIYIADVLGCYLMQLDPKKVYYLRHINKHEKCFEQFSQIEYNQDYKTFIQEKFYLKRSWYDTLSVLAFRYPFLNYIAFDSPLADLLHTILYWFREPFYDYKNPENTKK